MRTRVPPSPKSIVKTKSARPRRLDVGDTVKLEVPIVRIGPWKGGEGVTVELPDGTKHTFSASRLDEG